MKVLPLAEAKAKLSQLVADVSSTDQEITITRNGRAAAVLVSHDEFESWKETAEIMADPEFREQIRRGILDLKKRRAKTFRSADLDRLFRSDR